MVALPTHVPVMVDEVLGVLPLSAGSVVVDATLGLGGHAVLMGARVAPGGMLVGLDWDAVMLGRAESRLGLELGGLGVDVRLFHRDYRGLRDCLDEACSGSGREFGADGVLMDLGLNNAQIEDSERGISFRSEGPLDMRMDRSRGEPASAALNRMSVGEIERVLWDYGDERWARRIAQVIVERRKQSALETTADLVDCVLAAVPAAMRDKRLHPATRTFQAVRIYVNRETEGLQEAVEDAARCLRVGGVLVALSYHSGEDRAVKLAARSLKESGEFEVLTKKPVRPSEGEVARNPKSRSASLRAVRRLGASGFVGRGVEN